jgi:hypothetical protein
VVCRPKDEGGLGIHELDVKNTVPLGKWMFKILAEDGVWQTLLRRKYVGSNVLLQVYRKHSDSHIWASRMAMKKHFFRFRSFSIKNGSEIRFWKDKWLGNDIRQKNDTIATVMESSLPKIAPRLLAWIALLEHLALVQYMLGTDEFYWNLHENGNFCVDSIYKALIQPIVLVHNKALIQPIVLVHNNSTFCSWSSLQYPENCDVSTEVYTRLEATTINIFPSLKGHISFGLDHHHLRRSTISQC